MSIQKAGNDICSMCYQFNMWHKGGGMFCLGVEGEEQDEAEANDSVVHPIELDYKKDSTNDDDDDDEEDAAGYTISGRASLQIIAETNVGAAAADGENDDNIIGIVDDDSDDNHNKIYNDNAETEEKDEVFYQREERALKRATLLAKLRKNIDEARSIRKLARKLVLLSR